VRLGARYPIRENRIHYLQIRYGDGLATELLQSNDAMDDSPQKTRWLLPSVLSITAGSVDVIGFLSLGGLLAAHITGNLAILAAHYVTGRFGELGPLLSVPVFVTVLGVVAITFGPPEKPRTFRRALLVLHAFLLAVFLGIGVWLGPLNNADSGPAVFVGMLGVSAMATQNALVRLVLPGSATTAVMTTNTTQLTIDLATLIRKRATAEELAKARKRASATFPVVFGFVAGCAAGALLYIGLGFSALALPLILAMVAIPLGESWSEAS
jgi:uncharacterized membrane protein YoaK (UPF0700 family)